MTLTALDLVTAAKQRIRELGHGGARARPGEFRILDVREPAELATVKLPGASRRPIGPLELQIGGHPDFAGGIKAWTKAGLPLKS